ncbi:MAG: histidinol-phosphate transaminase [Agriterribacter sp.]
MSTNRRNWLKQMGFGLAGVSIAPLESIAGSLTNFDPGKIDNKITRLSSNENPYGPSPLTRKAMADNIIFSNRYNGEQLTTLISSLAQKNKVTADNILMTAGSTEVLDSMARLAALKKGSIVVPFPTFDYFTTPAQHIGLTKITVPLTADKKIDLPAVLSAIRPDTSLVYICNPNNPTGTLCNREALVQFVQEASQKTMILLDEAYLDFTEEKSLSELVLQNKNLVIAKTFSKIYGLAGARAGYAMAHAETIEAITKLQSWPHGSISVVSTAGALAALNDHAFVKDVYQKIHQSRKYAIAQMERIGIHCIPSNTNFIYFSLENYKKDFFEQLKKNNIIGTKFYEEDGKWSRITVGTQAEMEKYINAIV